MYFLFTESKILRFTIQINNSIYKMLPTIQGRIPILTTMLPTTSVVKIPIWILEFYDFTIQHHEKYSNLNQILEVVESS